MKKPMAHYTRHLPDDDDIIMSPSQAAVGTIIAILLVALLAFESRHQSTPVVRYTCAPMEDTL